MVYKMITRSLFDNVNIIPKIDLHCSSFGSQRVCLPAVHALAEDAHKASTLVTDPNYGKRRTAFVNVLFFRKCHNNIAYQGKFET